MINVVTGGTMQKRFIVKLSLFLLFTITACKLPISGKSRDELIEVAVKGITIDVQSNSPMVILEDKKENKVMPIWIGLNEARAIATELEGISLPRPMTHDLMKNIISGLNASLEKVIVSDLKNSTFYALVVIKLKRKSIEFDARPSDAIALALRFSVPIYVEKSVFDKAQVFQIPSELPQGWQDVIMGFSAQDLSRELSEAMGLKDVSGVLVSDVRLGSSSERDGLKRGDIIISADDKAITSLKDLIEVITQSEGRPMNVKILREGREITLTLHPGEGE